ncbi:MAG: hypothetical protein AAFN77_13915 [Planctomycetota bacterium]
MNSDQYYRSPQSTCSRTAVKSNHRSKVLTYQMIIVLASVVSIIAFFLFNLNLFDFSGQPAGRLMQRSTSSSWFESTAMAQESAENTIMWRYTNEGWQDVSALIVPEDQSSEGIENVHPLVWSALVALGVSMLVIWASNESDIAKLAGDSAAADE